MALRHLAIAASLLLLAAQACHAGQSCANGTAERPVHALELESGSTFCLRLPRLLKNPEAAVAGTATFARTFDDTCGLYAITLHRHLPPGAGPVPHVHWSDEEFFMPTTPGDAVRMFAQANTKPLRLYAAGEVPGYNLPPVTPVGHADVTYGRIAYSPVNIPHAWKAVNNVTNFMAFWINGFVMKPSINIPAGGGNATQVLLETAIWGSPADITNRMFGGADFVTTALKYRALLPPVPLEALKRLQKRFDDGEACYPRGGVRS